MKLIPKHQGGDKIYKEADGTYTVNNHPISINDEGYVVDQITGQQGSVGLHGITVTPYSSYSQSAYIHNPITEIRNWLSPRIMEGIRSMYNSGGEEGWKPFFKGFSDINPYDYKQNSFLMDRDSQKRYLLEHGFRRGTKSDVPLIKSSIGNYPVYVDAAPQNISRKDLAVINNDRTPVFVNANQTKFARSPALRHSGSFPVANYYDKNGNFYTMMNDLNDYGGNNGSTSSFLGDILDHIGSPIGVSSGYRLRETKDDIKRMVEIMSPKDPPSKNSIYGDYSGTYTYNPHRVSKKNPKIC